MKLCVQCVRVRVHMLMLGYEHVVASASTLARAWCVVFVVGCGWEPRLKAAGP